MTEFELLEAGYYVPVIGDAQHVSYPAKGNENCYAMEESSQWFAARNRTLEWAMHQFPFSGDFLDIGGGNGYQLRHFQQHMFLKRSINSAMCEPGVVGCANAASRGVKNVYNCLFADFPFSLYNVGGIGLFDVVEHIEHDSIFLSEMAEKVASGTRIYITVPALRFLWSGEDALAGHYRRYVKEDVIRLVRETGLKQIFTTYFFSYYVPFVWALRVLPEKLGRHRDDQELTENEKKYHAAGGIMNGLLNGCHAVEHAMIKRGTRPLFGTSLLMIFEKP
jgi:hypothetical protein